MADPFLQVQLSRGPDRSRVLAPAVGLWSGGPRSGSLVRPGDTVGRLRCLNRQLLLVLPDGAAGQVERAPGQRVVPVEFGQPLFDLLPAAAAGAGLEPGAVGQAVATSGIPAGCHGVNAPTDGVFYARPAPDQAAFVEPGARVHAGQPVGLVEVMKTFNQILYGGPGLPDEAEVVEVRCADGEEVAAGQLLLIVR